MPKRSLLLALVFAAAPSLALAHPEGAAHTHTFIDGVLHPLSGLDHLLVMLAVGVWATRLGPKAMLVAPIAFASGMSIGIFTGANTPFVEPAVAFSAIVLGFALAFSFRPALSVAAALIIVAGFFHGAAHAADASGQTGAAFALGALMMTMLLHMVGIAIGANSAGWFLLSARSRA